MRSYRPDELFDPNGALRPEIAALAPTGKRRMSANPHANGGLLMRDLDLPDIADYAIKIEKPGEGLAKSTAVMAEYLRDAIRASEASRNFRLFGPDETASNRLSHVFEATDRAWDAETLPYDDHLAPSGRVMEILSEHTCQGWLEGYLLTGRHGLFNCYEAFIHIVDSMFNQHAKWLKTCREILGAGPSRPSTIFSLRMFGARTITGSATRTPASSIMSATRNPTLYEYTCLPMRTRCFMLPTIAFEAGTAST